MPDPSPEQRALAELVEATKGLRPVKRHDPCWSSSLREQAQETYDREFAALKAALNHAHAALAGSPQQAEPGVAKLGPVRERRPLVVQSVLGDEQAEPQRDLGGCRNCHGSGKVLDRHGIPTGVDCLLCDGTGNRQYGDSSTERVEDVPTDAEAEGHWQRRAKLAEACERAVVKRCNAEEERRKKAEAEIRELRAGQVSAPAEPRDFAQEWLDESGDNLDAFERSRRAATGKIERTSKERREARERHARERAGGVPTDAMELLRKSASLLERFRERPVSAPEPRREEALRQRLRDEAKTLCESIAALSEVSVPAEPTDEGVQ